MATFTVDSDNNITACAGVPAAAENLQAFSSAEQLTKLTAEWPVSRLVETWNSFAGVAPFDDLKPVRKFTSRKVAVTRLWEAVQCLSPDVAPQSTRVARSGPGRGSSPAKASRRARAQKHATEWRTNKKAEVIALMKRAKGATMAEIVETTGWQKHTVRGFVSVLGGKSGQKIEPAKNAAGERAYRITK
jgi:hypothetical protein